jgi:peptidoglycan/LPS O-acetylase OafA/YrhL
MKLTTAMRFAIAAAALVSGYAHLSLYNDGYKDIPVGHIGAQFLLNALSSVALAAGLLVPLAVPMFERWVPRAAALGAVAWAAVGLIAFWQARTSGGWFGYQVIVLVGAMALLALLVGSLRTKRSAAATPVS